MNSFDHSSADKSPPIPPNRPGDAAAAAPGKSAAGRAGSGGLVPFVAPRRRGPWGDGAAMLRAAFDRRLQIGATAAAFTAIAAIAASAVSYEASQEQTVVARNAETQSLAQTVAALKAKLGTLDAAKRDEVADLRKTVAELKTGLAAARESTAGVGQANARADRLEREEQARRDEIADLRKSLADLKAGVAAAHEASAGVAQQVNARADRLEHDEQARLDKLGERIDHEAGLHDADFAARLDKLEKRLPAPQIAAAAPSPALPGPPATGAGKVSNETTGSIAPLGPPIRGWIVREVRDGLAIVQGPHGFRQIGPGDRLAGIGRVEKIERTAAGPVVVTDQGVIGGPPASNGYRPGPYGAGVEGYGPPEGAY
jgi:hypothetical protein